MPAQLTARLGSVKGEVIRGAVLHRPRVLVLEFARFCIPRGALSRADNTGRRCVARRNNPQSGASFRLGPYRIGAPAGQNLAKTREEAVALGISAQHA
jgi:hypothetical protein